MSPLRRIIGWQWRHNRAAFALGILAAFVPALAGLALLGLAGWFITASAIAGLAGVFLNVFAPSAAIRGLAIARTAGRYGERMITHDATFRFLADLRCRIFRKQASAAMSRPGTVRSGAALNRLTSDVSALDTIYLRLVVPLAIAAGVGLAVLAWLGLVAPAAAVGVAVYGLGVIVLSLRMARANGQAARRQEAAQEAIRLRGVDLVAGRRDLAIYGGLDAAARSVEAADQRLGETETLIDRVSGRFGALSSLLGQSFVAVMLVLVAVAIVDGSVSVALGIGILLVAVALPELAAALIPGLSALPRTRLAARRAVAGDRDEHTKAAADAGEPAPQDIRQPATRAGEVLTFRSVTFRYPGAERPVLSRFDLGIAAGEVCALTGRSGCGKSTVSALAARLVVPQAGEVLLSGARLAEVDEAELRRKVVVLTQKPHLFHDSVAANLRIADPAASDDRLWAALERAALAERIRTSPDRLDTVLGEGGLGLSGGEQRRLGLARAYLTRPVLWILDEMTEGLDAEIAADVLDRFFSFRGEATVLMIAHKPQEVARADRVLRLPDADSRLAAE